MAAGINKSAPTRRMVPRRKIPNVIVSVRRVPTVKGVGFLAPRLAAKAIGAMIGRNRPNSMTRPVPISHCGLYGAGGLLLSLGLFEPQVCWSPPNSEPLLAEAELNS